MMAAVRESWSFSLAARLFAPGREPGHVGRWALFTQEFPAQVSNRQAKTALIIKKCSTNTSNASDVCGEGERNALKAAVLRLKVNPAFCSLDQGK
jgi:hypothetical protein